MLGALHTSNPKALVSRAGLGLGLPPQVTYIHTRLGGWVAAGGVSKMVCIRTSLDRLNMATHTTHTAYQSQASLVPPREKGFVTDGYTRCRSPGLHPGGWFEFTNELVQYKG